MNRHELPRNKPARNAKDEIADDLPTLEPVADDLPTLTPADDDLPTLEPIADAAAPEPKGPVQVACLPAEGGFDVVLQVDVADMDKKAVADAVKAPLARACTMESGKLRHRKALVRFGGEAIIGSAAKELVAETLKAHKPLLVIVRRGMGDETVAQGKLPEVAVTTSEQAGVTKVDVATGELDAADLALALQPHHAALRAAATGKRVRLAFTGKIRPDAALRGELAALLQAAGARAAAIGERVLFDKDLTDRVRAAAEGARARIAVQCADADETTLDALELALPEHAALCQGKVVRFDMSTPAAAPRARCLDWAREHGAVRVDFGDEIAWPPLVALVAGAEVALRLQANGRTPTQTLAALVAEASAHAAACKGNAVLLDWPAGFSLDAAAGKALCEVVGVLQPKTLVCSFGGEQREPFVPDPCAFAQDGEATTVTLDSEAGKPVELQRAIDRRLPGKAKELRGKAVRVQVAGGGALSRTLLRGVCATFEQAGVGRLELADSNGVDVLVPPMLTVHKQPDGLRLAARTDGRDEAQQKKAIARELDAAGVQPGAVVAITVSAATDALVAAVLAKGAARVVLDGDAPVQVHPPLLGAPDKTGAAVRVVVTPGGDDAMVGRQLDRELPKLVAALPALANATATMVWSGGDAASPGVARLVAAFVDKQAAKVLFDRGDGKPQQLHPVPQVAPSAPAAAELPTLPLAGPSMLQLLARRDDGALPMVVVGVPAGTDAAHVAAVEADVQRHLPRFHGRAVLLVLRAGGQDVPVRRIDPMVEMLRRTVPTTAAATLVFRGSDNQGRPHFQALHSRVDTLAAGVTFADPRARR
ncbi:MAG: hypothetical protein FJ301_05540 [Planctomycetes bacterium]|nr:hypothetical protein [Planctomycetota bacterium]